MEGTILELAARLNLGRRALEGIIASHGIPVVGHRKTRNGGFRGGVSRLYRLGDILEKLGRKPPSLPPTALRTKTAAPDGFEDWHERLFGYPPLVGVNYAKTDAKTKESDL